MMRLPSKPILPLELAKQMLAASETRSREMGLTTSIAIVDDGGHLLAFLRMDRIHAATAEVAIAKAKSSAMFKRPTSTFGDALATGAIGLLALPAVLPFAGGLPLIADGQIVGAIGASGASADQDAEIAAAGAALFEKALSNYS
jgi:glc operon protein GlcG